MSQRVEIGTIIDKDEKWGDDEYEIRYTHDSCRCSMGCYPDTLEFREKGEKHWCSIELEGDWKGFMYMLLEKAGVELKPEAGPDAGAGVEEQDGTPK